MAWEISLTTLVRNLVNDLGATEEFTDARIEFAIATGAMITINQYTFSNDYVIDLEAPDINPDPTDAATYDALAIALFSLKAACILTLGQMQTAAPTAGIKVRDGDSEVTTSDGMKGYDLLLKEGPCGMYRTIVADSQFTLNSGRGKAVFGPFGSTESISGDNYGGQYWNARTFFNRFFYR